MHSRNFQCLGWPLLDVTGCRFILFSVISGPIKFRRIGHLDIIEAKMPSVAPYHSNSDGDDESEVGSEGPVNPIDENFIDDEVEEIEADDFPSYFDEIDGRLFPSWPSSPYPLPVDTSEQEVDQRFSSLPPLSNLFLATESFQQPRSFVDWSPLR